MNQFRIIRPASAVTFPDALSSLLDRMGRFFRSEAAEGRHPVFVRFFLSDAQNQEKNLRDISDYPVVDAYMRERFPAIPRIILEARVCRPSWLIEMECEVIPL